MAWWWIKKDFKGNSHDMTEVPAWHAPGETQGNMKTSASADFIAKIQIKHTQNSSPECLLPLEEPVWW
jgi:hypothetical protein